MDFLINHSPTSSSGSSSEWKHCHSSVSPINRCIWNQKIDETPLWIIATKIHPLNTNLSFINWKMERRMMSSTNMSAPCAQFQMSVIRKMTLPGVSKNEIISRIQAMHAITKSPRYNWTLENGTALQIRKKI